MGWCFHPVASFQPIKTDLIRIVCMNLIRKSFGHNFIIQSNLSLDLGWLWTEPANIHRHFDFVLHDSRRLWFNTVTGYSTKKDSTPRPQFKSHNQEIRVPSLKKAISKMRPLTFKRWRARSTVASLSLWWLITMSLAWNSWVLEAQSYDCKFTNIWSKGVLINSL